MDSELLDNSVAYNENAIDTFNDLQNYKRPWSEELGLQSGLETNKGSPSNHLLHKSNSSQIHMSDNTSISNVETEAFLKWDSEPLRLIVCIHILASVAKVGRVIGRKGEILRSLRKKYNCDIVISDHNYDYRIVSLTGHYKFLSECLTAIYEKLEYGKPIQLHAMILVPEPVCGYIIGKHGNGLKQLRKEFDVKFIIDRKIVKWKRKADVLGFFDSVIACINKIIYLYTLSHYDTVNKSIDESTTIPNNLNLVSQTSHISSESNSYNNDVNHDDRKIPYERPNKLQRVQNEQIESSEKTLQEIVFELSGDEIEVHMYLPLEFIGRIIGIKGKTIDLIREISGANITVKEELIPSMTTTFPNGENPTLKKSYARVWL